MEGTLLLPTVLFLMHDPSHYALVKYIAFMVTLFMLVSTPLQSNLKFLSFSHENMIKILAANKLPLHDHIHTSSSATFSNQFFNHSDEISLSIEYDQATNFSVPVILLI